MDACGKPVKRGVGTTKGERNMLTAGHLATAGLAILGLGCSVAIAGCSGGDRASITQPGSGVSSISGSAYPAQGPGPPDFGCWKTDGTWDPDCRRPWPWGPGMMGPGPWGRGMMGPGPDDPANPDPANPGGPGMMGP